MIHPYDRRFEPEGLALNISRLFELCRDNKCAWNSLFVEIVHVMQTARRAGASVRQGFNDKISPGHDFL